MGSVTQVLADTDTLIELTDRNKSRHQKALDIVNSVEAGSGRVLYSVISDLEIIQGQKTKKEKYEIKRVISRFGLVYLNEVICLEAVELIATYSASHNLLLADALIAATAMILDVELFTFNTKDFRFIKGLKLYLAD